jgi:hypothetical protein
VRAGTANAAVPGNAAQIASRPSTTMYRDPQDTIGQPAPATPNIISWMGTIGHVPPGEGTVGQAGGEGAGTVASEEDE